MGRKKIIINPKSGENLRTLLDKHGVNHSRFAEELYITPKHLSNIINGRKNLTADMACAIAARFPGTRVEYLLGLDSYETEEQKKGALIDDVFRQEDIQEQIFDLLCSLLGLNFRTVVLSKSVTGGQYITESGETVEIDGGLSSWARNKHSCKITRSGLTVATCSIEDKYKLIEDIIDFATFKTQKLCEKGTV